MKMKIELTGTTPHWDRPEKHPVGLTRTDNGDVRISFSEYQERDFKPAQLIAALRALCPEEFK